MFQVKIIKQTNHMKLENDVNEFLSEQDSSITVKEIKYELGLDAPGLSSSLGAVWTAMVIYEKK